MADAQDTHLEFQSGAYPGNVHTSWSPWFFSRVPFREATHLLAAARVASQLQPLQLGVFPRPYVLSSLPHRDVTMQGAVDVKGDFRFYQGVWRLQELPNCAQPGYSAMRLTYSVELSPRAWVPVALLEGNIATALGENLEAIRDFVVASDGCSTEY